MSQGVFIPIRLNSERLPKKSLKLINGLPIIYYVFDRIMQSHFIGSKKDIVVCTTEEETDDQLEEVVKKFGVNIFRGSKDDLIKRFYHANKKFNFSNILLVDGDDPLIFPEHIDRIISENDNKKFDCIYTSNLPFGLNIKSVTSDGLNTVYNNYLSKENDTGFGLYFTEANIISSKEINDFKFNDILLKSRFTLDYLEDFELIKKIINDLYIQNNSDYTFQTFEKYIIKNKDILNINLFRQNENIQRSKSKMNLKYKNKDKIFKIKY